MLGFLQIWTVAVTVATCSAASVPEPPQLDQERYRVTVLPDGLFLTTNDDGRRTFGGFLVDMLQEISQRGNFTYELLTPSGLGDDCNPQLSLDHPDVYSSGYHFQFDCGTNDVNDLQGTDYATDMYLGLFFVSPERQLKNYFAMPFQPPHRGTPAMVGTATGIHSVEHLIQLQKQGEQPPVCIFGSTATLAFVQESYPDLIIEPVYGNVGTKLDDGTCTVFIMSYPGAAAFVAHRADSGTCLAKGKPIGIIGEPMEFGLNHYAIGVGKHLDPRVVNTLSYWTNELMIEGRLVELYDGGTGRECGYIQYPQEEDSRLLPRKHIAAISLGVLCLVVLVCLVLHRIMLRRQQARYKMRFVQQIARNIQIGPRPGSIRPEKLSEQILHIGQGKEFISKEDLAKWMHDIKMDFISEKDFDALWNAMDIHRTGQVDAVEFIVFLSACGPEFEKAFYQQENMPKQDRLKLAARRLSTIAAAGEEEEVQDSDRRMDTDSTGTCGN